jgi:HAD superfamily hydrolase (TIGR01509 family)
MSRKLIVAELTSATRPRSAPRDVLSSAAHGRPMLRPVRGLMFDFGGVLYDDTVWRRWLLRLLSHLGMRAHYRSFFHVLEHEYMVLVYTGRTDFCEALSRFLHSAGLSSGQIDEVLAACHGRRRELEESTRPLPGVRCTLARLKKLGLSLGLLSDSELPADEIRQRLDRFATSETFCSVVSSFDVGCTKPSPLGYQRTLREMGLPGEQVAYVGHDPAELEGARRLGMATIAFNAPGETVADVQLDRFEQLTEVISPIQQLAAAG